MLVDEAKLIAEKIGTNHYVPLARYFMMFLISYGREYDYEKDKYADGETHDTLMNAVIWDWQRELVPLGYMTEDWTKAIHSIGNHTFRLTDKAIDKIKETNNVS
jgi:hypothetical protein